MYLIIVLLTMLVLPAISWATNVFFFPSGIAAIVLLGKWFVFWAIGIRLFVAGLRQVLQPSFTAKHIFEIDDVKSHVIVQELGFANISLGAVGIISLWISGWVEPAALLGCVFYGLAGINHIFKTKNKTEWIAMISDLYASVVLLIVFVDRCL